MFQIFSGQSCCSKTSAYHRHAIRACLVFKPRICKSKRKKSSFFVLLEQAGLQIEVRGIQGRDSWGNCFQRREMTKMIRSIKTAKYEVTEQAICSSKRRKGEYCALFNASLTFVSKEDYRLLN
jgi:hypothetical protein